MEYTTQQWNGAIPPGTPVQLPSSYTTQQWNGYVPPGTTIGTPAAAPAPLPDYNPPAPAPVETVNNYYYPAAPAPAPPVPNIVAGPTQVVVSQAPGIPSGHGPLMYIVSWVIWAYLWMMFAAISIYFIHSDFDIVDTLQHLILLIIYPVVLVFMTIAGWVYKYLYCPLDKVWFSIYTSIVGVAYSLNPFKSYHPPTYVPPKFCPPAYSGCVATTHPRFMSWQWFYCPKNHLKVGGQCTIACSSNPGYGPIPPPT